MGLISTKGTEVIPFFFYLCCPVLADAFRRVALNLYKTKSISLETEGCGSVWLAAR